MAVEPKEAVKEPKKRRKSYRGILIILLCFVAGLILAVVGYSFLFDSGMDTKAGGALVSVTSEDKKSKAGVYSAGEAKVAPEAGAQGVVEIIKFEPFIVNLLNSGGNRYLKITINIELYSGSLKEAQGKNAQIRDSLITLLASKSYADLNNVSGKYQLRDEIAARINLILFKGSVKSVYFTGFVIQ